jgi:hypothetical protein
MKRDRKPKDGMMEGKTTAVMKSGPPAGRWFI